MKIYISYLLILLLIPELLSCQEKSEFSENQKILIHTKEFNDYWYSGKAELDAYNLKQARYGEIHDGKAVLIFVTEPFSRSKQVKLDYPEKYGVDKQSVLKLNFTKKFTTGIYPYSMMMSAFTPVEEANPSPKISMSSQEWCGHVYSQLNLNKENYHLSSFSYFEQEGDLEKDIPAGLLEDELWNLIRINPDKLPIGDLQIIPSLFHTRLLHKELKAKSVHASMVKHEDYNVYSLEYPDDKRVISITFENQFPFKVLSWREKIVGLDGKEIITSAVLDKTLVIDYWSKHKNSDRYLRDSLNLE